MEANLQNTLVQKVSIERTFSKKLEIISQGTLQHQSQNSSGKPVKGNNKSAPNKKKSFPVAICR